MAFNFHDIGGYNGKKVDVWAYAPSVAASTPTTIATDPKSKIRGAQGLDCNAELSEEKVSELGEEATQAIYGTADYSASVSLLKRDLLQVARLAGVSASNRIVLSEFSKINLIAHYRDPDTNTVNLTKYAGGFQAKTNNSTDSATGNSECTLEGSCDIIGEFDGQCEVVQHEGDGITTQFAVPAAVDSIGHVLLVENPAGHICVPTTDYTVAAGLVTFGIAPQDGAIIRIVHNEWQTSNIV